MDPRWDFVKQGFDNIACYPCSVWKCLSQQALAAVAAAGLPWRRKAVAGEWQVGIRLC
jgi:hypothetical protein